MKTLIATTALMATVGAHAVVFHLDWKVDASAGEFLFTLDTSDGSLVWDAGSLWVSGSAAASAVIPGQTMVLGNLVLETPDMIRPNFVWPDEATTATPPLQTALLYNPALGVWAAPAGRQYVSPEDAAYLTANQGVFRLDDDPSNSGVLSGPVQHAPEPQTIALLAGFGLLGLAAYRRVSQRS